MSDVRFSLAHSVATIAVAGIIAVGFATARPDVVVVALPIALWIVMTVTAPKPSTPTVSLEMAADQGESADLVAVAEADGEMVELDVQVVGERYSLVTVSGEPLTVTRRIYHSGPTDLFTVATIARSGDATLMSAPSSQHTLAMELEPEEIRLNRLPVRRHLLGLHGTHPGQKQGDDGDFRDLHEYQPGDQLRRVDWRATARMARNPGDLIVRRMNTQSEANVFIVVDNMEDLGAVVSTWGTVDEAGSGVTSLDWAREAARAIAQRAIDVGDRVGYLELVPGGRSVRAGSGRRHAERLRAAIARTGPTVVRGRMRRPPVLPSGSTIYVLAAFLDGAARDLSLQWQANGHRVVAIDILPHLDSANLSADQEIALRIINAERMVSFSELRGAAIDVFRWADGDKRAVALSLAAQVRRR